MKAKKHSRRAFLRMTALTGAGMVGAAYGATPTPTSVPPAGATLAQAAPTATPPRIAKSITLKFWWLHGGAIGKAVEAAYKVFQEKNPGITIEPLQAPAAELQTKVSAALAAGTGPDVWNSERFTLQYASRGALRSLDEFLAGSKINVDDYPQKLAMVWKGKTYAIPAIESGMENALVWNKRLFKEAGLDPEKPPKTLAELTDVAKKLTKSDSAGNITQLGFNTRDSSGGMFPNWLTSQGIVMFDQNTQKIMFTQPEAIEFVEWLVAYEKALNPAKVGAFHKTYPTWGSVTPGGAFCTGKEAMIIDGSWCPGGLAKLAPSGDFGYTWVPTKSGTLKAQQMGVHQLSMNAQTKAADAAWKLIEFFAAEGNDLIYKASGSFAYSKPFASKVDTSPWKGLQWYFDSLAQASFIKPRGYCPVVADAQRNWWAAVDDLVWGRQASAKEALAKAERETQKLLDDMLKS